MARTLSRAERMEAIARAERRYGMMEGEGLTNRMEDPDGVRAYPVLADETRHATFKGVGSVGDSVTLRPELAERSWTLYRCLYLRSAAMASLPFVPTRDGGTVDSGPLHELLREVNPHWDWRTLMFMTEWTLCTSNRGAFWILDGFDGGDSGDLSQPPKGKPTEIWWVNPDDITPVQGAKSDKPEDWYLKHFERAIPGKRKGQVIDRRRVVWIRMPSPRNEFGHACPLAPAMGPTLLALSGMGANIQLHETGLTGAGIIHPTKGGTWTAAHMEQVQGMLAATLKGKPGWHKTAVINRGDIEITPINTLSPRDLQFEKLLSMTERQICEALGVPMALLQQDSATFSNLEGARASFWSNGMMTQASIYAGAIDSQLTRAHFSDEADASDFDFSAVPELQENAREKLAMDRDRFELVSKLAALVDNGYPRESAVAAAVMFAGLTEEEASSLIPEGIARVSLPPLTDLRLLLAGVASGDVSRDSAVAVLEILTGSREQALAIVADAGTSARNVPLPILNFARDLLADVTAGRMPLSAAAALLSEAIGAEKVGTVLADVAPALPAPADEAPPAEPSVATPDGMSFVAPDTQPARGVLVYEGGVGYRVRDAYGSEQHRRAWQRESDRLDARAGELYPEAARILGSHVARIQTGLDRVSEAALEAALGDGEIMADLVLGSAWVPEATEAARVPWERALLALLPTVTDDAMDDIRAAAGEGSWEADALLATEAEHARLAEEGAALFAVAVVGTTRSKLVDAMGAAATADAARKAAAHLVELWSEPTERAWSKSPISRASFWAVSEAGQASAHARLIAARASQLPLQRTWLSQADGKVRKTHVAAHGQVRGLAEPFSVGQTTCDEPRLCVDYREAAECRCFTRLEVLRG
jgi:hypothetical protein